MIVRMAKVEIIGPKELLLPTLEVVREAGVLQVEPALLTIASDVDRLHLHSTLLDRQNLAERLYFGELKRRIEMLLAILPETTGRETFLSPARAVASLNRLAEPASSSRGPCPGCRSGSAGLPSTWPNGSGRRTSG